MNIFVTGSSGYIGGSVASNLIKNGFKVTGLVRSSERAKHIEKFGIDPIIGNLNDSKLLSKSASNSDGVIHTADAEHKSSVIAIIQGLKSSGKPFIHTSGSSIVSDIAKGKPSETIFEDNSQFTPLPGRTNRVAINKLVTESITYNIRSTVLAPSLIYGNGIGFNKDSMQLPWLIKLAKKRGCAQHIGAGKNIWANVHIEDLVDLYLLILLNPSAKGFYFAENGESSINNVCQRINQSLGFNNPPQSITMEDASKEWGTMVAEYTMGSNSRVKAKRARKELGWNPSMPSLEDFITTIKK